MSEAFDLHHDHGWKLYKEEKYEEAIREWREASRLDPKSGDVLNDIARALSELGHREAAIAEWREATRLEPDHEWAHINLASALILSGASPEALAAVQAALSFSPKSPGLLNYLGYVLMKQAKEDNDTMRLMEAGAAFQQAVELDPGNSYASQNLALVQWHLKQKREAIQTLKEAIAINPDDAEAHVQLWNYQSRAREFRGMIQTIDLMGRLPESEALNRHYEEINNRWLHIRLNLLIGAGLVGLVAGVWIWYRRRG